MSAHISGGYAKEPPTYGKVLLNTTIGDIDIELWPKQAPKACRNFIQLIMEKYYDNNIFHRVIPNFMVQTGDPTGTGNGGQSCYGIPFKDEFHSRLTFCHRGIVAMANSGKNENQSQFFITLDKCDWLNRKHTIFGKVTGNTIYNVLKFNDLQIDKKNDKPFIQQKIKSIEILLNPFDDIIPRQNKIKINTNKEKNDKNDNNNKKKKRNKRFGAKKDIKLLAFGDDDDEDQEDQNVIETNKKIEKIRKERKKMESKQDDNIGKNNDDVVNDKNNNHVSESKMMQIIRSKLAGNGKQKKRTFSEMNHGDNDDILSKKRKTDNGTNDEYELLKRQLLEKQQENNHSIVDYGDDDDEEEEEDENNVNDENNINDENRSKDDMENVSAKLMKIKSASEYMKDSRMSKQERRKFTLNKLDEFKEIMDKRKANIVVDDNKEKKGRMDHATGIQFDSDSNDEDDDYDPDWFKNKLKFKKRPQDVEIYSVDDYETIYGNAVQDINSKQGKKSRNDKQRNDKKRNDKKHYSHRYRQ